MPKVKALVRGGGMWPDALSACALLIRPHFAAKRLAET